MRIFLAAAVLIGSWSIDPRQSVVGFTVTKFGREVVHGRFHDFSGTVQQNSMQWKVRIASVKTGERARDATLQGPEFFDARRYPEMTFVSDRIRSLPDGRIHVSGRLTIKGRTKPLVVTARQVGSSVFETRFHLNRHDFGVSGGSVSRHGISDRVDVHLRLTGVPK